MKRAYKRFAVALAVIFCILAAFILYLSWPLLTGTDIVLATRPVDPFDPLRGQYMAISYRISTLPAIDGVNEGDTVYVLLSQHNKVWENTSVTKERPDSGVFIRGVVTRKYGDTISVWYGIEQFFFEQGATVPTANITVHARVGSDGSARIVGLLQNGKPINITYRPVTS